MGSSSGWLWYRVWDQLLEGEELLGWQLGHEWLCLDPAWCQQVWDFARTAFVPNRVGQSQPNANTNTDTDTHADTYSNPRTMSRCLGSGHRRLVLGKLCVGQLPKRSLRV